MKKLFCRLFNHRFMYNVYAYDRITPRGSRCLCGVLAQGRAV